MYRNRYVSGSDATAAPLSATHSPVPTPSTRTHNQAHPHFPSRTVPAAALENHRGDPHLAGNEACMCSSCHIRDRFFPRSQDGRILLPPPSMSAHPTRSHRATHSLTSAAAPLATPNLATRRRSRAGSTASNRDPNIGETLPYRSRASTISNCLHGGVIHTSDKHCPDDSLHTPQMSRRDEPEGRPFSGPSRRTQQSKKYDHKSRRLEPSPLILESDAEFPSQPSQVVPGPPSQHMSRRNRLDSFIDKHGTNRPQSLIPSPLERELSPQMTRLDTARSTTPLATSQIPIGAHGHDHGPISSSPHQDIFDTSMSRYPQTPACRESSQRHFRHRSASRSHDIAQDKPKIIKFSSRSENPQPDAPTTSGEGSVHSNSTREFSHLLQSQIEEDSSSSSAGGTQTQFRFQEPVVPEADITSPTHSRDLSIVQVKWDSERKRRQGYFAQEEGTEKSPFRHYNKANCDFEG